MPSVKLRLPTRLLAVPMLLSASGWAPAAPQCFEDGRGAFIAAVPRAEGLSPDATAAALADARYRQAIIDAISRPYEAKPWPDYRRLFLTPERIAGGVAFARQHAALLAQAEAASGVPAAVITAIIGVETNYGQKTGDHRVLDALATLGFCHPERAEFFRGELAAYLKLAGEEGIDPGSARGSYAGAVGLPQFIPSSWRAYAVDFDGDGRRDLRRSTADAIGSVGNYLARHGWLRGAVIAEPARAERGLPQGVPIAERKPVEPSVSLGELAALGVVPAPADTGGSEADTGLAVTPESRATLIALPGEPPEYWLGFANFYAITRYNHSNLYAMAVFQLSRAIERGLAGAGD